MKKTAILFAITLFVLQMQAQDNAILESIKARNTAIGSMNSDIKKTLIKEDQTLVTGGTFHYVKPDNLAALFDNGTYMIISEGRLKINIGLFHGKFKLSRNKMMRSLSIIFLYGLQGRCQELADEGNYTLTTTKEENCLKIILINPKTRPNILGIGYKQIILKYSTTNLLLNEIILYDFKGNVDTYTLSSQKCNVSVDMSKFKH